MIIKLRANNKEFPITIENWGKMSKDQKTRYIVMDRTDDHFNNVDSKDQKVTNEAKSEKPKTDSKAKPEESDKK